MLNARKSYREEIKADNRGPFMHAHGQTEQNFALACPLDSYLMQDPLRRCISLAGKAYKINKTEECECPLPLPVNLIEAAPFHDLHKLP
jgi:hypothetical protein